MAIAVLVLLPAMAPAPRSAAASGPEPEPEPPHEVVYERGAQVTVTGVERDPRFGRAWLLARLPADGHLRTASTRLKAFAPPTDYEAGFVRIPLIPKLPVAKLLRRRGRALVTVAIYFRAEGTTESQKLHKTVTLVRGTHTRPVRDHH